MRELQYTFRDYKKLSNIPIDVVSALGNFDFKKFTGLFNVLEIIWSLKS